MCAAPQGWSVEPTPAPQTPRLASQRTPRRPDSTDNIAASALFVRTLVETTAAPRGVPPLTVTTTVAGLAGAESVSETESAATATQATEERVRYLPTQQVSAGHVVHTGGRA
jgi:hypothetical protein